MSFIGLPETMAVAHLIPAKLYLPRGSIYIANMEFEPQTIPYMVFGLNSILAI